MYDKGAYSASFMHVIVVVWVVKQINRDSEEAEDMSTAPIP